MPLDSPILELFSKTPESTTSEDYYYYYQVTKSEKNNNTLKEKIESF